MAQFSINTHRFDPYKNFKFRVKWDGRYVAGVSKVGALKRTIEVVTHREGGDPSTARNAPAAAKFEAITLERGVTHDPEFRDWADLVFNIQGDAVMSLRHFRKNIYLELLNEAGQVVKGYKIYRCWVSEYQALPELDANGNGVAFETLTLQNEGWEQDPAVTEPTET
ncbi:MAG TPA: phage tail protein [Kofleriaceae bacterium]|nr:phage tail protein [Kofleriaceae bacterium]